MAKAASLLVDGTAINATGGSGSRFSGRRRGCRRGDRGGCGRGGCGSSSDDGGRRRGGSRLGFFSLATSAEQRKQQQRQQNLLGHGVSSSVYIDWFFGAARTCFIIAKFMILSEKLSESPIGRGGLNMQCQQPMRCIYRVIARGIPAKPSTRRT
jgi:hypothetical protein